MLCPICNLAADCVDSRQIGSDRRRRYLCHSCGKRFSTREIYDDSAFGDKRTSCQRKTKKEPIAEAVELPPHGDLISRDDLLHTMRCHLALYDSCPEDLSLADKSRRDEIQNAIADIFNAPVVVPAERRE